MKAIITKSRILGTNRVVFTAWEPKEDHSTITTFDGEWYGKVGSGNLPAWIDAIPRGELRLNAFDLWFQAEATRARELILCAFPEAANGRNQGNEIYIIEDRETANEQVLLIGCTPADMPRIFAKSLAA